MSEPTLADFLNDFFKRSHAALLYALGHGGNLPPGFMSAPESPAATRSVPTSGAGASGGTPEAQEGS
jgi:hypothetical protein